MNTLLTLKGAYIVTITTVRWRWRPSPRVNMCRLPFARMLPGETGNPLRRARVPSKRRSWCTSRGLHLPVEQATMLLDRNCWSWFIYIHLYTAPHTSRRVAPRMTIDDNDTQLVLFNLYPLAYSATLRNYYLLSSLWSYRLAPSRRVNCWIMRFVSVNEPCELRIIERYAGVPRRHGFVEIRLPILEYDIILVGPLLPSI
jgi:hypothetical protein